MVITLIQTQLSTTPHLKSPLHHHHHYKHKSETNNNSISIKSNQDLKTKAAMSEPEELDLCTTPQVLSRSAAAAHLGFSPQLQHLVQTLLHRHLHELHETSYTPSPKSAKHLHEIHETSDTPSPKSAKTLHRTLYHHHLYC
ncbi:hypothetical protein Scep_005011 [Stephania cephalantha]|uniref:Uncharacterized protein n=1 Tax=Stephania cephalantha TaxID=152367 RepID=A0AAP0PVY2_9MAGN